jgi:crotonobetaine/carnitine-CoA ligase
VVGPRELAELAASAPKPAASLRGYDEDSVAAILYTSGSTGRSKGVMMRAGCFASVGDAFAERYGISGDDTYFLPTTLAHAVGCVTALSITLQRGGRLALADRFSPSSFWEQLAAAGGTYSILFPAHLNLLLEADRGTPAAGEHPLRLVITHAYVGRFRERFAVELATVWGMTETGALCVGSEPGYRGELGDNYIGTPMKGVEVAVLDERLQPVPAGEGGEIALRHRHVMLGYLKDPAATAQSLVDGWVRSGDLGRLDEHGRLFFVGRLKNMIKRSGENISAEEVEAALSSHPDVVECTVFAVADRIRTEEVFAAVVRRSGTTADPAVLRSFCAEQLARWKLPRYIAVRDEPLARLPNGKLDRVALRASLDLAAAWDAQSASGSR